MSDPERPNPHPHGGNALERFNATMRARLMGRSPHLGIIQLGEDIIHYVVALVLVAAAVMAAAARRLRAAAARRHT